jgi:putative transposase
MPWRIIDTMDQKIQLIADWQSGLFNVTDLSNKYGLSRPIIYKWVNRYEEQGLDGLKEQSRKPNYSPNQTGDDIIQLIIKEKLKNSNRGPKKVYNQLKRQYPDINWPAPSTIGEHLKKHGLVKDRKRRLRVPPYTEPFKTCQEPNSVWSTDYKGQFYMQNNHICYPLTISDNYSRYLIKCKGLPGPRYQPTRKVFESAFREYGLPDAIRMDNGTPFASKGIGGLSRLSVWWIQLGIAPERIEKGCPEQNGRHERMHRTLKAEAISSKALNMKEQQTRFDWFCFDYNHNRPHESLGQKPPTDYYHKSEREYIEKPVLPNYDHSFIVRRVCSGGDIKLYGHRYYLTELLYGQDVGLKETADGQLTVYYSFQPIGTIDLRKNKVLKY